jgi:hypothetical protein
MIFDVKMKLKLFFFFAIVFMSILFVSCESSTEWSNVLINKSQFHLDVKGFDKVRNDEFHFVVSPGNEVNIFQFVKLGGSGDAGEAMQGLSELKIIRENGDTCEVNFYDNAVWSVTTIKTSRYPASWEHTFERIITDDDF